MNQNLVLHAELDALLIRADGSHRHAPTISAGSLDFKSALRKLKQPLSFWNRLWVEAKEKNVIPIAMTLGSFVQWLSTGDASSVGMALVTTAGVNYMAADFLSASSARINAFTYADCGTGTTAAAIGDTVLQSAAGTSRVSGTGTTPSSGQYRQVATIPFTGTLAITEYGLFSASTSGTLWDHRIFSAINVTNGDSIQFTYTLTVPAGGS
jgi:hypothetical protein